MADIGTESSHRASMRPDGDGLTLSATVHRAPRNSYSFNSTSTWPYHLPKRKHISWIQYWASITPLICGALGPTLTLMALSGCADRWRILELPDGSFHIEPDPQWVVVITAVAIVIGFIANIFLLMRMLGRANPKSMQYLCVTFWALECIIQTLGLD